MSDIDFVNKYLKDFSSLLKPNNDLVNKIKSQQLCRKHTSNLAFNYL